MARARANRYLAATAYGAANRAADFPEFVALMRAQREALPHMRNYTHAAFLELDADGNASLRRVLPIRRNASAAAAWTPVIRFLLDKKVRPAKVARIFAELAGAEPETVRTVWLTGR
jgi:hypothetical protein